MASTTSVTAVTCLYGDAGHSKYLPRWLEAISQVTDPAPDRIIIGTDRVRDIPEAIVVTSDCKWRHPHAWHLQQAAAQVYTDWIWICDLDDLPFPDALQGIENVEADVWLMGYVMGDMTHVVPVYTNDEYLARDDNQYCGASAIRTESFHEVGGFDDLGFQDWGLWRKMCRRGMRFKTSGRPIFHYMPPHTRSAREFTNSNRSMYLGEMQELGIA